MSTKLPLLYSVFGLAGTGGEGDPLCPPPFYTSPSIVSVFVCLNGSHASCPRSLMSIGHLCPHSLNLIPMNRCETSDLLGSRARWWEGEITLGWASGGGGLAGRRAVSGVDRLLNIIQAVWDLAVQTLGLQPGSFSRLFLRESVSLEYSDCP